MYIIWQLTPRRMLCGYRETKLEADNLIVQLQTKQKNAIFEARKQGDLHGNESSDDHSRLYTV